MAKNDAYGQGMALFEQARTIFKKLETDGPNNNVSMREFHEASVMMDDARSMRFAVPDSQQAKFAKEFTTTLKACDAAINAINSRPPAQNLPEDPNGVDEMDPDGEEDE